MENAEEQHQRLEEARLNLTTPFTSEDENYGRARPKTTSGAKLTSVVPSTLPQDAVVPKYSNHSILRLEQPLKDCAALLRDEVFSVIPGTVNAQCSTASQKQKMKSGRYTSEDEVLESDQLPQVPDMPIAGSGHGHKVTFRSPIMRPRSVSSSPHLVPQPVSFSLSGIPDTETPGRIQTVRQREGQM